MANFVLVHGGWQGGWVYRDVARLLRQNKHQVFAATLTGLGERCHLADLPINLDTHISDVENLINHEDLDDVVLVGHSYGGLVITGVADRIAHRISTLVYLDALVPANGNTLFHLRPEYHALFLEGAAAGGGRLIAPRPASHFDARAEFWPLIDRNNRPHPLACFTQALTLHGDHLKVKKEPISTPKAAFSTVRMSDTRINRARRFLQSRKLGTVSCWINRKKSAAS